MKCLAVALILFSVSAPAPQQRVAGEGFSVVAPQGPGWKVKRDAAQLRFERQSNGAPACDEVTTVITANRNFPTGTKATWGEEEVAEDYRDGEQGDMMVRGTLTQMYDLMDVQQGVTTRGDKKLYFMRYRQRVPSVATNRRIQSMIDAALYLYFPPEFTRNRFFYVLLIVKGCKPIKDANVPVQSTEEILPLIDSLAIQAPR